MSKWGCLKGSKEAYKTHLSPFNKSKFNLKSDRVNLVAPANPIHTARYSTNWDRKG